MKIKVTVDSTNDLSPELLDRYGIRVIPLSVSLGDRTGKDGIDVLPEDIIAFVDAGGDLPKTSAVNVDEYRTVFEEELQKYEAVIHINLSSEMSSCYRNACLAAEGLPVYPIDSRHLSTGSAHLAIRACEMAREGLPADEIAERLNELKKHVDTSFILGRLDYMHKGGRCSAVAMLGANLLKLRPCIEVKDGVMGVGKKYRGPYLKCAEQYIKDRFSAPDIDLKRVFITHSKMPEDLLDQIRTIVENTLPFEEILMTEAGATITSHCGDMCVGVLFVHKV